MSRFARNYTSWDLSIRSDEPEQMGPTQLYLVSVERFVPEMANDWSVNSRVDHQM